MKKPPSSADLLIIVPRLQMPFRVCSRYIQLNSNTYGFEQTSAPRNHVYPWCSVTMKTRTEKCRPRSHPSPSGSLVLRNPPRRKVRSMHFSKSHWSSAPKSAFKGIRSRGWRLHCSLGLWCRGQINQIFFFSLLCVFSSFTRLIWGRIGWRQASKEQIKVNSRA